MQTIRLSISGETGMLLPDIPMINKKNSTFYSYVYHKDDTGYNKPLLFRYAEKTTKGMFVRFPIELLNIREASDKKAGGNRIFPITKEGLLLEHYLLYKIAYIIDSNYRINNSINLSFMLKELQIIFPENDRSEYVKKERMLESIKSFMNRLLECQFISGYRLRESAKNTADVGLNGYERIEIFSKI